MTGEQFLNSIRGLDCEINALDTERCRMADRRRDLMEKAESLGAGLNGVCVQHAVSSKTESLGVALADLMTPEEVARKLNQYQERINRRIDLLVDRKQQAQEAIGQIADARCRALLIYRYINGYKWVTIADLMKYTENWVKVDLKQMAIAEFERCMKTTT